MSNPEPWIALADTPELPISKTAFKEVEVGLNVRNIALPYKLSLIHISEPTRR